MLTVETPTIMQPEVAYPSSFDFLTGEETEGYGTR